MDSVEEEKKKKRKSNPKSRKKVSITAEELDEISTTEQTGTGEETTEKTVEKTAENKQQQQEEEEELEDELIISKPLISIGQEETKALLDTFDEQTLSRYEVFRRAHLPKTSMRRIVSNLVGPVPAPVAIVVSGVAKVFVGEIVEGALEVRDELKETGPCTPDHIRESFRRYQKRYKTMSSRIYSGVPSGSGGLI
jgi:transcription initiation factor TFIID subunit 11